MSKDRKVCVDYFSVIEEKGTFCQILKDIEAITDKENRNYYTDDTPVRLDEIHKVSLSKVNTIEGDLIKIRMDNIPMRASVKGSKKTLGLNDDEGLGEETAFLYAPEHNVVIIQRNRWGTTPRKFETYFNHFGTRSNSMITLEPMICRDTIEKMESANSYRKLIVKVQPFKSAEMLKECGAAVGHAIDAMKDVGGEKIEICVSLTRVKEKTLNMKNIQKMVKNLLKFNEDSQGNGVQKLQMAADMEDVGIEPIDFLKDRLQYADEIECDNHRQISYTSRRNLLRRAWACKEFQDLLSFRQESS